MDPLSSSFKARQRSAEFGPAEAEPMASVEQTPEPAVDVPARMPGADSQQPSGSLPAIADRVVTPVAAQQPAAPHPADQLLEDLLLEKRHQVYHQREQQALRCVYGGEPVTCCELLAHLLRRRVDLSKRPELIQVSDQQLNEMLTRGGSRLAGYAVRCLPGSLLLRQMKDPNLARVLIGHRPWWFNQLPEEMKTKDSLSSLLKTLPSSQRCALLQVISMENPQLLRSLETLERQISRDPESITTIPVEQLSFSLCQRAVSRSPALLPWCRTHVNDQEYETLCDLALKHSGSALKYIAEEYRTATRVDQALAHPAPPHVLAIPASLRTHSRLKIALDRCAPSSHAYEEKIPRAFLDQWQLWDTFKEKENWLAFLPEEERTESLCHEYMVRFPHGLEFVPRVVLYQHPEWSELTWSDTIRAPLDKHRYVPLPQLRSDECLAAFVTRNSECMALLPETRLQAMPAWALALASQDKQMRFLSHEDRQCILRNAGTKGLAAAFGAPPFAVDPEALLDPIQENDCTSRAASIPAEVRKKLTFCDDFQLPRAQYGQQLRKAMDQNTRSIYRKVTSRQLETREPGASDDWQVRGGRTLVRDSDGRCIHMKFQRKDESLATFAAEEAVQGFALSHRETLGLRSEIPEPEGIFFVPLEALPEATRGFADALEIRDDQGRPGCLAFCFSTKDHSYDTLAWKAGNGESGDSDQARQGLMHAFHDLGVWSSMGVMHTSTIALYHHFLAAGESRPELLLTGLFDPEEGYPGSLQLWNTKATAASDWGYSGLRDLGDVELYPFMTSYTESSDAHWTAPDYAQRASFVNALAQNILGGFLHSMRLHQDQPGYHYRDERALATMAGVVEEGFDAVLGGLLGDGVRLEALFPDQKTYKEWLTLTAREMIYWTARQNPEENDDCFAQHFKDNARPCAQLYPGHPARSCRYGPHFTEADGENLGANNSKLPLLYLVRGLYVMAAGLADRLATPDSSPLSQGV